ncbi:MAG: IclR family transcriptional regulator [Silicimonas sp.]|nr:IclR family transcriptional regulator [Silicimonas sp.]
MKSSIVQKVLTLLTVISEAQKPLTFSEVVKKSGLNKSTIHRLLAICTEEKMVRYDPEHKVYLLGPRVFDLVKSANSGFDIQAIALDEMVRLFDLYDANVTLGIPSGLEVVYLRILEAPHSLGGVQRPGMREPVHCSASGKALLAFLPDKVIESKLKDYEFTRFTKRTITAAKGFRAELDAVRERGYATNDREEYDHFLGISAPIFDYVGEAIAVLNIWSVYPQHTIEDLHEWSEDLRLSADRVTDLIGGTVPAERESAIN